MMELLREDRQGPYRVFPAPGHGTPGLGALGAVRPRIQ